MLHLNSNYYFLPYALKPQYVTFDAALKSSLANNKNFSVKGVKSGFGHYEPMQGNEIITTVYTINLAIHNKLEVKIIFCIIY